LIESLVVNSYYECELDTLRSCFVTNVDYIILYKFTIKYIK